MSKPSTSDALLANGWPVTIVEDCLKGKAQDRIVSFLRARHEERFFDPIEHLRNSKNKEGYGFAIMSLCSLLVETLQSYRYGLPSTNGGELERLKVPKTEWKTGKDAFADFFSFPRHQAIFSKVDGEAFYSDIRNGLLHQAQTKNGWKIKTNQKVMCDPATKIIDRDKFSLGLKTAFDEYLNELENGLWTDDLWVKAVKKIEWLVKLS